MGLLPVKSWCLDRALVCVLMLHAVLVLVLAADPDPIFDFCVADPSSSLLINGLPCKRAPSVTSADFKSELLREGGNTSNPLGIALNAAVAATFPALNTQGLSIVRIDYATDGLVPPHVHPRASEVVLVIQGTVAVGFVDTTGALFSATLNAGDLFVFPRGLVHYQLNVGGLPALSYSSLNSQNPGVSLVASALFGSTPGVPDPVLEKTLGLTAAQVEGIKKAFH